MKENTGGKPAWLCGPGTSDRGFPLFNIQSYTNEPLPVHDSITGMRKKTLWKPAWLCGPGTNDRGFLVIQNTFMHS